MMSTKIQIAKDLYDAMVHYIQHHFDPVCHEEYSRICAGIRLKESNIRRRNLFCAYKTEKDPDTAEMLRQAYLDESGIPSHGRWDAETDISFRNSPIE
jgi:hypothetical protein